MTELGLAAKTAIVTGSGRGLGASYARELARRGVNVVVSDLGTAADGSGVDIGVADTVAQEIKAAGGTAIADHGDVTSEADMKALVARAVDSFGGIDIVIANAGICGSRPFLETTLEEFRRYWDIHVAGSINVIRAAWPHLKQSVAARVVLTESNAGLYGMEGQAVYAAAKGAIHGLMRTLSIEAAADGILVNAIAPGGYSRMHEAAIEDHEMLDATRAMMPSERAAAVAVWLSSSACEISGQVFSAWAGRAARVAIGTGHGFFRDMLTAEDVAAHSAEILQTGELYEPASSLDEVASWQMRMADKPD